MERFARLYVALDSTTRTLPKVAALEAYFREAPPEDAAWALFVLSGRRIKRAVTHTDLRLAAAEAAGLPEWMINECYNAAGDLSETIALVVPPPAQPGEIALHQAFERFIIPMRRMDEGARRQALRTIWSILPQDQRLIFHKLISGSFRVGVSRTLTVRALAQVAQVDQGEMDHRLMGEWEPTPAGLARILAGTPGEASSRPYPFFLASQWDDPPDALGERSAWQAEWKWDGIRAQLIRRGGRTHLWSRGEDLVTDRFPEVVRSADALPDGTVLDGELLAWDAGADRPRPFADLQTRTGRTRYQAEGGWLFEQTPVAFVAYDVLEHAGVDVRGTPLRERRALLEAIVTAAGAGLRLSPTIDASTWAALAELRTQSRERRVEGIMLKRLDSPYGVGRTRGDWWKWKIDPYHVDAVVIAAERGHGRRAGLYTDYTFALWSGESSGEGELVPVAKAYSGLTDEEIRRVDAFVKANTTGRFGPVRSVKPELVFELAFEGIQESPRHKSGLAVRFPRIAHWRLDKKPAEADTLGTLRHMLRAHRG